MSIQGKTRNREGEEKHCRRSALSPSAQKKGSSVKCVDTFRIALTEELELFIKQNIAKTVLPVYPVIILRRRNLFILIR